MSQDQYTVSLDRVANVPVSEGIHTFQITNIEEGESKENHNPMWTVRLLCVDPTGADNGKDCTLWLPLTDNMRWKLEKFFDAVGAPTAGSVTKSQFNGRKFKAQVSHSKGDGGRVLANINEMFPVSASNPTPRQTGANTAQVAGASSQTVVRTGDAAVARTTVTPSPRPGKKAQGLPAEEVGENVQPFETS